MDPPGTGDSRPEDPERLTSGVIFRDARLQLRERVLGAWQLQRARPASTAIAATVVVARVREENSGVPLVLRLMVSRFAAGSDGVEDAMGRSDHDSDDSEVPPLLVEEEPWQPEGLGLSRWRVRNASGAVNLILRLPAYNADRVQARMAARGEQWPWQAEEEALQLLGEEGGPARAEQQQQEEQEQQQLAVAQQKRALRAARKLQKRADRGVRAGGKAAARAALPRPHPRRCPSSGFRR